MEYIDPTIGQRVIYHDSRGRSHEALVLCVHGASHPSVNLVIVSSDKNKDDSFGRQIERPCSIVHKTNQAAHGEYWRHPDEEPNPVADITK